jgi:hypothetical protein
MAGKQSSKLIVDLLLFSAFLGAFFLDLTGIEQHEWIGVGIGLLAFYHLITHWSWLRVVTKRFFRKTSAQARLYHLLDGAILAGFLLIGFTGLSISTWLNLSLDSYDVWVNVHILASIVTLAFPAMKIGLHWRWIVSTTRKIIPQPELATRVHQPARMPVASI